MSTTYYVSNNSSGNPLGSNSYDGLSPTVDGGGVGPWLTPEYGMATMVGGDRLEIRGGTYTWTRPDAFTDVPSGTAGAWTIITNYNDEISTHNYGGSTNLGLLKFDTSSRSYQYISFEASVQDGMKFDMLDAAGKSQAIKYAGTTGRFATNPNKFLKFENLEVCNSVDSGLLGYYCTDIEIINCTVHDNGDSLGDHGIYINDSRTTIRGGRYYNNSGFGVHHWNSANTDILVEKVECWNNGWGGIVLVGGAAGAFRCINNISYAHTTNDGDGIVIYAASGTQVYHNLTHGNKIGIRFGKFGQVTNGDISNNQSLNNTSKDIYLHQSSGTTFKDNITTAAPDVSGEPGVTQTRTVSSINAVDECIDPNNATLASRDYHLKTGATSINKAGLTLVGVGHDKDGIIRPQGGVGDCGPYELRASLWSPPGPWLDSTLDDRTIRFLVRGSDIGDTVSTIKMFLIGRSTGSYTVTGVSIAERDGATLNVVDATNEQVTFGGTWAAGVTVPANTEVESDAIAIDIAPTSDYFITFHCAAGQPTAYSGTAEGTTSWHMLGVDHTGTLDWGALSIDTTREFPYIAFRLEETIVSPTASAPGFNVTLSQTVSPGTLHDLNADVSDQDGNIVSGYVLCAAGNVGLDFDPSGCTITHKTS